MTYSNSQDSQRARERAQFRGANSRQSVWEPFVWQGYVAPQALPLGVEAYEHRKRSRHSRDVFADRLEATLPRLAEALRKLKKGLRDRSLDQVLVGNSQLRPLVSRVRIAEAVLYPNYPLLPDWKQYSGRIRADYAYYADVGRALETLAWAQALDDQIEVRRCGGAPLAAGPPLRQWGLLYAAQPLAAQLWRREQVAVARLQRRLGTASAEPASGSASPWGGGGPASGSASPWGGPGPAASTTARWAAPLQERAQAHGQQVYRALSQPGGCWGFFAPDWQLHRAVGKLRVSLQALGCADSLLPAHPRQFSLAGGDPADNRRAWMAHLDHWWQCSETHTAFTQNSVLRAVPANASSSFHLEIGR